jgi:curved DNA-binding protein CbpA
MMMTTQRQINEFRYPIGPDLRPSDAFGPDGFDDEGYDSDGFDTYGFKKNGLNNQGFYRDGFNDNGYDRDGFDRKGYDRKGFNREGWDIKGYNREGFNWNGFDRNGFNREGLNREGFNRYGYDCYGYDREGRRALRLIPEEEKELMGKSLPPIHNYREMDHTHCGVKYTGEKPSEIIFNIMRTFNARKGEKIQPFTKDDYAMLESLFERLKTSSLNPAYHANPKEDHVTIVDWVEPINDINKIKGRVRVINHFHVTSFEDSRFMTIVMTMCAITSRPVGKEDRLHLQAIADASRELENILYPTI